MISKHTYKNLTWIDAEAPTKEEIEALGREYKLPHLVREELMTETVHSKVDSYPNLIYLVLHFPTGRPENKNGPEQEIDFVIGQDFLITIHYETVDPLYEFAKRFEIHSALEKMHIGDHAGYIFYSLIKNIYRTLNSDLEKISVSLKKIENGIFAGQEGLMVKTISNLNRELLDFRQTLLLHQEIWHSLETMTGKFFGADFIYYISSIRGEHNKLKNMLDGQKDILNDLRDTNDSLLSSKISETMRTLAIISFVIFPLTLIAGIFGMNTRILPFVGTPYDFWKILGIMAVAMIIMFTFFKYKKWL